MPKSVEASDMNGDPKQAVERTLQPRLAPHHGLVEEAQGLHLVLVALHLSQQEDKARNCHC